MVKIFAYQKTDHDAWQIDQDQKAAEAEKRRLEIEAEKAEEKRMREAKLEKSSK